jgi:hypothetical protein
MQINNKKYNNIPSLNMFKNGNTGIYYSYGNGACKAIDKDITNGQN